MILGNDIYLQTPHAGQSLLNSELTQHFSSSLLTSYEILLLSPPNLLHLKHWNVLNLPKLLLLLKEGKPIWGPAHPELQDTRLTNPDLMLMGHIVEMKRGISKLVMLLLLNRNYLK